MRANKHYEKWVNDYTHSIKRDKDRYHGRPAAPCRHLTVRQAGNSATIKLFALFSFIPLTAFYFLKEVCKATARTAEAVVGSMDSLRDTD